MLETIETEIIDAEVIAPKDVSRRFANLRREPSSTASSFVSCGEAFLSFGMLPEASDAYSEALERDPGCVSALVGRGKVAYALALLEEEESERERLSLQSVSDLKQSLELGDKNHEAVCGVGSGLLLMNRFAECSLWIEERLSLTSDRSEQGDLLYLFALCRLFAGDAEEAIQSAEKMERIAGFDVESSFIRGLANYFLREQEDFAECRTVVRRRDKKLAGVLSAIADGEKCATFLDLARLLA